MQVIVDDVVPALQADFNLVEGEPSAIAVFPKIWGLMHPQRNLPGIC